LRSGPRIQAITLVHAIMSCVAVLLGVQFLLLLVAVEAFLGDGDALLWPAAAASGLCCAGSCWLARFLTPRAR